MQLSLFESLKQHLRSRYSLNKHNAYINCILRIFSPKMNLHLRHNSTVLHWYILFYSTINLAKSQEKLWNIESILRIKWSLYLFILYIFLIYSFYFSLDSSKCVYFRRKALDGKETWPFSKTISYWQWEILYNEMKLLPFSFEFHLPTTFTVSFTSAKMHFTRASPISPLFCPSRKLEWMHKTNSKRFRLFGMYFN